MTITKLTAPLLLAAALLFTSACDTEEAAVDGERAADLDDSFAPDLEAGEAGEHHRGKHRRMNPAAHLCEEVSCSDEQRASIEELFRSKHEAHRAERGDKDAKRVAHAEQRSKLAEAFRADELDTSVIAQLHGERDPSEHIESMAQFAVELHALLTPEQRKQLAETMAERGPMFFHGKGRHGKRGHHGKKGPHGKKGDGEGRHAKGEGGKHHDPEARLAHHVERFCEPLDCSDAQKTQLEAAFAGAHEARKDAPKPDLAPFAAAFSADELEAATLVELMRDAKHEGADAHLEGAGNILSELHAILTPAQRGIFADTLESEGLRGALGKKRGHKRGHGRR